MPLRLGVSGTSITLDTTQLGGGSAIFRVIATDGTFVAQADSAPFNVAMKPPTPQINTPNNLVANFGQTATFAGEASDPQDGSLTGGSLVWSNKDGVMSVGDALPFSNLRAGANVITLTATNSQGLSASTAITVFVDDDLSLRGPTLSVAPTQLSFAFADAGSAPQSETVNISNVGGGTLNWTVSTTATWLTLSATSGVAPADLVVTANPVGVPNGTALSGHVVLQWVNNGVTQSVEVPVSMVVGALPLLGAPERGPERRYLPLVSR